MDSRVFKDVLGRWRTKSLFYEECPDPKSYPPMFTLGEDDREEGGVTHLSLKRKYLEYMDPHEFIFAEKMFGSYPCWENLCASPFFKPHVEQWRKELALKIASISFEKLQKLDDPVTHRWIVEGKYEEKGSRRGRPSNKLTVVPKEEAVTSIAARMGM